MNLANTCNSSFAMMIAKMLLFVCVSSDRKLKVAFDQIGTTEDNEAFQVEVNSAGFVPFSTHSAKVSAHNSFIEERDRAKPKEEVDRATAPGELSQEQIRMLSPMMAVNLVRALNGGSPPTFNGGDPPDLPKLTSPLALEFVGVISAIKEELYEDTYSKQVITKYGQSMLDRMIANPSMLAFMYATNLLVALRTRFIDDKVNQAMRQGVKQIVYLGMGLDTRALRLKSPGVEVYEVDIDLVLDFKLAALPEKYTDGYPATYLRADYLADPSVIGTLGLDHAKRVLFVWESRAVYTEQDDMTRLFHFIFQEFPKASVVFDTIAPEMKKSELLETIETAISAPHPRQAMFRNTIDLRTFATESGITIKETISCETYAGGVFEVEPPIGVVAEAQGYLPTGDPVRLADVVLKHLHFNIATAPMNGHGTAFLVNLVRALDGGDPPGLAAFSGNARELVKKITAITPTLYKDSYSKQVISPPAELLFNQMSFGILDFVYVTNLMVALRTRFIDDEINQAIADGIKQIVYLGMGLDTRALRLKSPDVEVYEVDFDDLLNTKLKALPEEYKKPYPATYLGADYLADPTVIGSLGGLDRAEGVLFVWESRSVYTTEEDMIRLFSSFVEQGFKPRIVFDMVDTKMGGFGLLEEIEKKMGRKVFEELKDMSQIAERLAEIGLTLKTKHCAAYAKEMIAPQWEAYLPEAEAQDLASHVLEHMHFNVAIPT